MAIMGFMTMNRILRERRLLWLAVGLFVITMVVLCKTASTGDAGAEPRQQMELTEGWDFLLLPNPDDAKALVEGGGENWKAISLPYSWITPEISMGGNELLTKGVGYYRHVFQRPPSWSKKHIVIRFLGANFLTRVWLNGRMQGEHRGGFTAFSFDLTDGLKPGDNLLMVSVDNRPCNDPSADKSSFNQYGGIYRQVSLIAVDAPHVSLTDHGASGVYISQGALSAAEATMTCVVKLRQYEPKTVATMVSVAIKDALGKEVASITKTVPCSKDEETAASIPFTITNPHLWQGRKDPHLYLAEVRISSQDRLTDKITQRFGIRTFAVDADKGSRLNGTHYDLHGVNLHQDRQRKGWLVSHRDRSDDVALIKDMGATFVRLVHYPHHPDIYDLLDEAGIMAWSEIPCAGLFTMRQCQKDDAKSQLREMIRQLYNHPSIAVWGLYNEIPVTSEYQQLIQDLVHIAHEEDASRPAVGSSVLNDNTPMHQVTDLVGLNRYFGWYFPSTDRMKPWAEECHQQFPKMAFGLSEYGAGASPRKHAEQCFEPLLNYRAFSGIPHPEEYQALYHERIWGQIQSVDYLWCKTVWEMFDHESNQCQDGDELHVCDMGLVSRDRSIRKDAYYFYQASWSDKPVIYITSRRFSPRMSEFISVKVYTNLPQVTATIDGKPLSNPVRSGCAVTWRNVQLHAGVNSVTVSGQRGDQLYRDEVQWTWNP